MGNGDRRNDQPHRGGTSETTDQVGGYGQRREGELTLGPIFMATWPISLMFHAGRTLAAVTLYTGQPVTSSVHPEVSSLARIRGWNARNTWPTTPRRLDGRRPRSFGGSLVDQIKC